MQIVYQFDSTSTEYCSRDDSLRSQARTLAHFARFLLDMLKEKPEPTFFGCSDSVGLEVEGNMFVPPVPRQEKKVEGKANLSRNSMLPATNHRSNQSNA